MFKMFLALACLLLVSGLVIASEYTIVSYHAGRKILVLKDKTGKEVECQLTERTKVTCLKKDGSKVEGDVARLEKMLSAEEATGKKIDATVEQGRVTEITAKRGKSATP